MAPTWKILGTVWEGYFQLLGEISGTTLEPSDSCGNLRFTLYKHSQVIWGKMDGRATNSLSQTTTSFSAMSGIPSPGRSSSTQGAQHPFSSTSATGPFNAGSDSTSSTWYSLLCNYFKKNLILSFILRKNFDFWTQDNRFHLHFCFFSFFFCCQRPWTKASGGPFSFLNFFSEFLTLDEGERRKNLWKTLCRWSDQPERLAWAPEAFWEEAGWGWDRVSEEGDVLALELGDVAFEGSRSWSQICPPHGSHRRTSRMSLQKFHQNY